MNHAASRSTPGTMHAFPHVVERGSSTRLRSTYIFFFRLFSSFSYHHFLISMLFHQRWFSSRRSRACSNSHAYVHSLPPFGLAATRCQRNALPEADWPQTTSINEHIKPAFPVVNEKWSASWIRLVLISLVQDAGSWILNVALLLSSHGRGERVWCRLILYNPVKVTN